MNQHAKMLANSRIEPEAFPLPYRVFESVLVLFWKDSLKLSHSAKSITLSLSSECRPSCVVVRGAGCYTKSPRFESRVRHGCQTVRPRPHQWLRRNTSRREVPGSFLSRVCRPSRTVFSVLFSETHVNTD